MILIFLLFLQLVFIFFLPVNISSGDGAELVTAVSLNGIAHPSGYPLYILLAKLFTFLPFGTLAFRISLFSSVCSVFSFYFLYKILIKITHSKLAVFFSIISLFLSYSFFLQSLIQKFYTLNLLLIIILIYLGIIVLIDGYNKKIQYLSFFIIGLISSCHHTGLFMLIPLLFIAIIYRKDFFKNILFSFLSFFLGFITNIYIFLKLNAHAFTLFPLQTTVKEIFYKYFLRGMYSESSVATMESSFSNFTGYFFALMNNIKIIQTNFPLYFTYIFFILGAIFIFKKNIKIFIFIFLSFCCYSIFLGKLTFSNPNPTIVEYYIAANQYFIPMLAIFSLICGVGIFYLMDFVKKQFQYVHYIIIILPIFYLIIFPIRIKDNLWSNNLAVYQSRVDRVFTKPINSNYLTIGDNPAFQVAYLKKIANFRNDICQILFKSFNNCYLVNCFNKPYIDEYKRNELKKILYNNYSAKFPLFFSSSKTKLPKNFFNIKFLSDYLVIFKNTPLNNEFYFKDNIKSIPFLNSEKKVNFKFKISKDLGINIEKLKKKFKIFYNHLPCLEHSTDDYFTYGSCYSTYIDNLYVPIDIRIKLSRYNSSLMPYILNDSNLKKKFTLEDYE